MNFYKLMKKFNWKKLHKELEDALKKMTPKDWEEWEIQRKEGEQQYKNAHKTNKKKINDERAN